MLRPYGDGSFSAGGVRFHGMTRALGGGGEARIAMGNDSSVGEILRAVREASGWTQAEAAKRIGVARNTVSRWELGQLKPTGVQRARALEVYGLVDAPVVPQALRELEERVAALERW